MRRLRRDTEPSATSLVQGWTQDERGAGPRVGGNARILDDAPQVIVTNSARPIVAAAELARTDIYWQGATDPGGTVETAYACAVDAAGVAVCDRPLVLRARMAASG